MSSVCRQLHGILTKTPPPLATAKPSPSPSPSPSSAARKQRSLQNLVEDFKTKTMSARFRSRQQNYYNIVHRLAFAKHFSLIDDILQHSKQFIKSDGFAARLISLYGRAGMFDHARQLFEELPDLKCERNSLSFNALLSACVDSKEYEKFREIFRELPEKVGLKRDFVSYNILVKAYCEMGDMESAVLVLDELEKNGMQPNLVTFNTILEGFYKKGMFSDGDKIWELMQSKNFDPDIRSYNSRLRGMVNNCRIEEAVELVKEMGSKGIQLDVYSYNALIKGFCDDGNLEEAKRWYGELKKNNYSPDRMTVLNLAPLLCEKGDLDMAFELCVVATNHRLLVGKALLQSVVDKLFKESMIDEARKLVALGRSNKYFFYDIALPVDK